MPGKLVEDGFLEKAKDPDCREELVKVVMECC